LRSVFPVPNSNFPSLISGGKSARPVDNSFSAGQKDDEDITKRTIKAHRHRVMEKMQVQTFAGPVSVAERVGTLGAVSAT
jgi:hypothetical protein